MLSSDGIGQFTVQEEYCGGLSSVRAGQFFGSVGTSQFFYHGANRCADLSTELSLS
jgi:hypothetical protein